MELTEFIKTYNTIQGQIRVFNKKGELVKCSYNNQGVSIDFSPAN